MRRGWDREKYGGSREVRGGHELGEGGSRKRPGETRSGVRTERGGGIGGEHHEAQWGRKGKGLG